MSDEDQPESSFDKIPSDFAEPADEETANGPEADSRPRPFFRSVRERRSFGHLWLISYSDFMTILMIFFLGMYGYASLAKAALAKKKPTYVSYGEFAEMVGKLKTDLTEELKVENNVSKVVIQMPDAVLFPSGRAKLTEKAKEALQELGTSLKLVEGDIIVEGHTDNVPIRHGSYSSNWELSAARAFAVIEELTYQGLPPQRLAAWGFGENRPLASNDDQEGRAKNRRIEIVLIKKDVKGETDGR